MGIMYEIWVLENRSKLKKIIRVKDTEEKEIIVEQLKNYGYGYNIVNLKGVEI